MGATYVTAITQPDAQRVLAFLKNESELQVVSYGEHAVDLQFSDAPSPHAVNLDASYSAGSLRLVFHMTEAAEERLREWLVKRARALGVPLELSLVPG